MQDMNFYVTSQPADMNLGQWSRTTLQVVVRTKFAHQGLLDKMKNYCFAKLGASFAASYYIGRPQRHCKEETSNYLDASNIVCPCVKGIVKIEIMHGM